MKLFPSATIAHYTGRMFLVRVVAFITALVLILQTLDLLAESDKILAAAGNGNAELWHYVTLRAPQLISQFLPFSVLLATLVTLATLNQNSEVVILKAAGISAHQILAPLIVVAGLVAALHFLFNETVLARTNGELAAWEKVDYGAISAKTPTNREAWVRDGASIYHVKDVIGLGAATRLDDITIYIRSKGELATIVRAASARPVPGGWRLAQVRRFDVARGRQTLLPVQIIPTDVGPARFTATAVVPDRTSFWELRRTVHELRAAGRPVSTLEAALHHKIASPLSSVLMPILGAVAAFGLVRSGKLFVRTVIGMALGFAYFVADNFMVAMGEFGAVPAWLSAWAPFLLFFLIGEAVLFRTEE